MIKFQNKEYVSVQDETMKEIYEKIKTPYKYGPVIKIDNFLCDSPTVFRYKGKWYMSFIQINKDTSDSGYDSHLAESDDLISWKYLFPTLKRQDNTNWDSKQVAAYSALVENDFYGNFNINNIDGYYYFSYLGGKLNGYETDPLLMGLCKTKDILNIDMYERFDKPILSPFDSDVRNGENVTLYKSCIFEDKSQVLGYRYVNVYNAKGTNNKESIFLSVSNNYKKWERYGETAIIYDDSPNQNIKINGDPQIIKINDIYVMFYFILQDGKTYNTFACSYDLIHWTKWKGKALIEPENEWENVYAHKPWVIVNNDTVYHFYCACNRKGERFIALATSKKII